jgi:hypothetical protein
MRGRPERLPRGHRSSLPADAGATLNGAPGPALTLLRLAQ